MKKIIWLPVGLAAIILILTGILVFYKSPEVKITSVKSGQEISSPLVVEGKARGSWFFEANLPIKITDKDGNILGSSYATAKTDWMTDDFVEFKGTLSYQSKTGGNGFLVVAKDNPSGLAEYDKEIKIPVVLKPSGFTTIKVFFNNNKMDPEISCNKVFASEREILKIEAIGSAAINELLRGPTQAEKDQGFFTNINSEVKLLSLNIDENETAFVDFDEQLQQGVGGSCKVAAIRAQITETLKQFPTIKSVIISVNGRTEDILQP
jgi:hypothetical protein